VLVNLVPAARGLSGTIGLRPSRPCVPFSGERRGALAPLHPLPYRRAANTSLDEEASYSEARDKAPDSSRCNDAAPRRCEVGGSVVAVDLEEIASAESDAFDFDWRERENERTCPLAVHRITNTPQAPRYWTFTNLPFAFRVISTRSEPRITPCQKATAIALITKNEATSSLDVDKIP